MDPKLKQRLVGATVLSALAVIFVPMLFDDSGSRLDTRDFEIPEIPAQIEQNQPQPPQELGDTEPFVPPVSTSEPVQNSPNPEPNPGHENKAQLTAWVIQVGSFGKQENADQLRDRLRKAGFPAYVESGKQNGTVIFRVRVGPELDQQRARNQRDSIARKFDVKGIVLPVP
ncbi:MAG: SPOR domain-containing protein [Methylococcaceae bacterium]|nr:SPOR domain-containing protein [Methylococcaceae bacterium]